MKHFLILCVLCLWGCAKPVHVGNSFSASEEPFFDDGIDVVADHSKLSGQFAFDAEEELNARSNLSDVIAEVTVLSVQINQDISGQEQRRIDVSIDRVLFGSFEKTSYLLISNSDSTGYTLLQRHETALKGKQLLFLRTFPTSDGDGNIGHHFHLSPIAPGILSELRILIDKRNEEIEKQEK